MKKVLELLESLQASGNDACTIEDLIQADLDRKESAKEIKDITLEELEEILTGEVEALD